MYVLINKYINNLQNVLQNWNNFRRNNSQALHEKKENYTIFNLNIEKKRKINKIHKNYEKIKIAPEKTPIEEDLEKIKQIIYPL